MDNNSRVVLVSDAVLKDQTPFEELGFTFEPVDSRHTRITLPEGWIMADIDEDAFTTDFIDPDGCSHGKFCCGNYPRIRESIWLYKDLRPGVIDKNEIAAILEEQLQRNR